MPFPALTHENAKLALILPFVNGGRRKMDSNRRSNELRAAALPVTVVFRKSYEARAAFPTLRRSKRNNALPRRHGDERGCKILSGPDRTACPQ